MEVSILRDVYPQTAKLAALFNAAGLNRRTGDEAALTRAVAQSPLVVTAWDDEELVGLARGLTDGESVLFVADLVVDPRYRRRGVGGALLRELMAMLPQVSRVALVANPETEGFMREMGFADPGSLGLSAWIKE